METTLVLHVANKCFKNHLLTARWYKSIHKCDLRGFYVECEIDVLVDKWIYWDCAISCDWFVMIGSTFELISCSAALARDLLMDNTIKYYFKAKHKTNNFLIYFISDEPTVQSMWWTRSWFSFWRFYLWGLQGNLWTHNIYE